MMTDDLEAEQQELAPTPHRALVLEHDDFSLPGSFEGGAERLGFRLHEVRVDCGVTIPRPSDFEVLMVMGSIWSAYDPGIQGWFEPELAAIRSAVADDVPVLGVCFGAQALSTALGGQVYWAPEAEIGWRLVETQDPGRMEPGPWFEWHHDSFTLPRGASLLASNSAGIQAYALGNHLAVQFHPEITAEIVRCWLEEGEEDLARAGVDPAKLLADTERLVPERTEAAQLLLERFLDRALGVPGATDDVNTRETPSR